MDPQDSIKRGRTPFSGLLGASSLVVAVLFVAGFSYRWAYYYNFGAKHLVFELPFQSLVIGSLELIRSPANALLTLALVIVPLLALVIVLRSVRYGREARSKWIRAPAAGIYRFLALGNPFVADVLFALTLIYSAFLAGSLIGYRTYLEHINESPLNPLPTVTAIFSENGKIAPLLCGTEPDQPLDAIGDLARIRSLQKFNSTCSIEGRSWRLLFLSADFIYLFSTDSSTRDGRRPMTLVIPRSDGITLVMG